MTLRRVVRGVVAAAALLTAGEAVFTALAFASMRYRQHVPTAAAAQRLLLTRRIAGRLARRDPKVAAYTGGNQRFLGELGSDSPEWIEFAAPDALLGARNGRNITALVDGSVYVTNDEGFSSLGERDFHYGVSRQPGCRRMIVVGGSAVFGWGTGTPDRNLPARLRRALERNQPRCYEIVNAGVPGYTSAQEYLFIASELVHYGPDVLVVYDGWNDQVQSTVESESRAAGVNSLKTSTHTAIEDRVRASYSVAGSARLALLNAGSHLRRTGTFWVLGALARRFVDKPDPQVVPHYDAAAIGRYRSNLLAMIAVAADAKIPIALLLQPLKWVDGRELVGEETITARETAYADARRTFYRDARPMFASLAREYGRAGTVCVEDVSESVKNVEGTIYVDSGHLSGLGNDVVAAEIVNRLGRCGLLME
jgi:hypothetical protein